MTNPAVDRMTLTRQAAELLGKDIANGTYAIGDRIDPDRMLADHGISRTVFREAIRFLEGKGLVFAKPQIGTRVARTAEWNMFDADVVRWLAGTAIGRELGVHARQLHALLGTRPDMADNPLFKTALLTAVKIGMEVA